MDDNASQDPNESKENPSSSKNNHNNNKPVFEKTNAVDLVICCGSPGAGKSTFYWDHLQPLGYERVNQDILKSVSSSLLAYLIVFACCGVLNADC